jgi:hypothetical protein
MVQTNNSSFIGVQTFGVNAAGNSRSTHTRYAQQVAKGLAVSTVHNQSAALQRQAILNMIMRPQSAILSQSITPALAYKRTAKPTVAVNSSQYNAVRSAATSKTPGKYGGSSRLGLSTTKSAQKSKKRSQIVENQTIDNRSKVDITADNRQTSLAYAIRINSGNVSYS